MAESSGAPARPGPARTIVRGLTVRCPACGARGIFRSWFRLRERCTRCGLRLDRGERDHWIGAYMTNLILAETIAVVVLALVVVALWPDVPWQSIQTAGVILMILAPMLFFPVSRSLWLAADLLFRPASPADFEEPSTTAAGSPTRTGPPHRKH